jgi:hypothetical protein
MRLPLSHEGFGVATSRQGAATNPTWLITLDPRGMFTLDFALDFSPTTVSVTLNAKDTPLSFDAQLRETKLRVDPLTELQRSAIEQLREQLQSHSWRVHLEWSQLTLQLEPKSALEEDDWLTILAALTRVAKAFVAQDATELTRLMRAALVERDPERRAADQRCVRDHHMDDPRGLKLMLEIAETKAANITLRTESFETWLALNGERWTEHSLLAELERFFLHEDPALATIALSHLERLGADEPSVEEILIAGLNLERRAALHEHVIDVLGAIGTGKAIRSLSLIAASGLWGSPLRAHAKASITAIRLRAPRDVAGALSRPGESGNVSLAPEEQ